MSATAVLPCSTTPLGTLPAGVKVRMVLLQGIDWQERRNTRGVMDIFDPHAGAYLSDRVPQWFLPVNPEVCALRNHTRPRPKPKVDVRVQVGGHSLIFLLASLPAR